MMLNLLRDTSSTRAALALAAHVLRQAFEDAALPAAAVMRRPGSAGLGQ